MRRLSYLLLCIILLTGCGSSVEEDVVYTPPLTETYDTVSIENVQIDKIGSYSGYVQLSDRSVEIHPYYDLSECVTVTSILLSDRSWWDGIVSDFGDTIEVIDYDTFSVFTAPNGVTYGYMPCGDEYAIVAETSTLPSSYVRLVMSKIWTSDT